MRVTNGILADQVKRNINQGLEAMQKLQMRMASGKSIQEASDDPVGGEHGRGASRGRAARQPVPGKRGQCWQNSLSASEDASQQYPDAPEGGAHQPPQTGASEHSRGGPARDPRGPSGPIAARAARSFREPI